jgi:hypothetical protein
LWQNFFPLVLGDNVKINLIIEENSQAKTPLLPKETKKKEKLAAKVKRSKISGSMVVIFVLAMVFLTRQYWVKEKLNVSIKNSPLLELLKKKKCIEEREKKLCEPFDFSLGLHDGILIDGKSLYFFLDFENYQSLRKFPNIVSLPSPAEKINAQMYLQALTVFESPGFKNLNLLTISVLNYGATNGKLKTGIQVEVEKLKVLSPRDVKLVFSSLKTGDKSMFESLLVPASSPITID